ncbi:MAG TPA: ADP-ribosylglycohydrolase family protein, partial [Bacillota bacterium]|nr:ADP-ribosylglycohydrolase family protein [Bacillota bacterium]
MKYRDLGGLYWRLNVLAEFVKQSEEKKASGIDEEIKKIEAYIEKGWDEMAALTPDPELAAQEPDDYDAIIAKCPAGGGKNYGVAVDAAYREKLKAAILSRFAGCVLGAIVEGWRAEDIENYAAKIGAAYPPEDYWTDTPYPDQVRYIDSTCKDYLRQNMDSVPNDDDIAFVILSMLILERGGKDFTLDDVAEIWKEYVTMAYTAEDISLKNLKNGIAPEKAAEKGNCYQEWIGADIRCDGYAYAAPGDPRKAAKLAYTDAYLTHRRNGIYGSMFFAAAISASFALGDPFKAIEAALCEIPEHCRLADDIRWAMAERKNIKDYKDAIRLVDERFPGMSITHTLNN